MSVLQQILRRWHIRLWAKTFVACLVGEVFLWIVCCPVVSLSLFFAISAGLWALLMARNNHNLPKQEDVIRLINVQITSAPYSASLLENGTPNSLQALQQEKLLQSIRSQNLRFPIALHDLLWILILGALFTGLSFWKNPRQEKHAISPNKPSNPIHKTIAENDSISYHLEIIVVPPAYTRISAYRASTLDLDQIPAQSEIVWKWSFQQKSTNIRMHFADGDSIEIKPSGALEARKAFQETSFYRFDYQQPNGKVVRSNLHMIKILPDTPPEVSITGIDQYQQFEMTDMPSILFEVISSDNYGLQSVDLVTTLTKGYGESVRFREERIPIGESPIGKSLRKKISFTAKQFEMEPGNELYFYAEATDVGNPAKTSRTETYFFTIRDTAETSFSLEGDLGVDLMPEYFRSQRQIIIDSEQLLKERSTISKEEFNQRSNSLAADEKLLRLKYGQFVGEEASDGLAEEEHHEEEEHNPGEVDVLSEYGHDHDHENEEGENLERGTENPASAFTHSHDDAETDTFFHQSLKNKLKAAIAEMWNAELHLRMYDPTSSLPYQYKALTLLQDIKNQARIYVHKMGFDAPPIKEKSSRLTGKLEDVTSKSSNTAKEIPVDLPAIRMALTELQRTAQKSLPIENHLNNIFQEAGNELAALALENPAKYLTLLSEYEKLQKRSEITRMDLQALQRILLTVLPNARQQPRLKTHTQHPLLEDFIQEVKTSNHAF